MIPASSGGWKIARGLLGVLLVWVGAAALIRGISQIIAAFTIRSLRTAEA